jgi:hypothetical protein
MNYSVLKDIIDYYKHPEKKSDYIDKFIKLLERPDLRRFPRIYLNKFILEEFAFHSENLNELMRVEKILAYQIPFLITKSSAMITLIRTNYVNLAKFLTESGHRENYKKLDPMGFLRTKVYLFVYFKQNVEHIQEDLEFELQKDPSNAIVKDLLELVLIRKSKIESGKKLTL